jgi:hypothetical protein
MVIARGEKRVTPKNGVAETLQCCKMFFDYKNAQHKE